MALTKVGKEGVVGLDNSADATAINISSGENVGIGVVPETTWNSNIDALQLGLGASIYGDNTATGLQISANTVATLGSSLNGYKYIGSDKATTYQQYDGEHNFRVASSGSADGSITWITAMTIDNTGAVTKPLQPAFHVHKNGSGNNVANLAVNSDVQISWVAEQFDQNSDFDLTNNRFVAPVTGKYFLQIHIRFQEIDISAVYYYLSIVTSNQSYSFLLDPDFGDLDAEYYTIAFSVLADMDASDTANILFSQSGGAAQTDIDGNQEYTWFEGHLVA